MKKLHTFESFLAEAKTKSYQDIARELVEIAAYYTDVDLSDDMTNAMKCDDEDKVLVFYGDLKELMKEEEPGKYKEFEKEATAFLAKNKINESVINEGKQADIVIPANDASDLEEEGNYIKNLLKKAGVNTGFETGIGEIEIYLKNKSDLEKAKKTLDKDGLQYKVNEGKTIGALSDEDDAIYVEAKDMLAKELQKAYEEVGKKVQKVIDKAENKGLITSNLKAQAANDLVDVYGSKFLKP